MYVRSTGRCFDKACPYYHRGSMFTLSIWNPPTHLFCFVWETWQHNSKVATPWVIGLKLSSPRVRIRYVSCSGAAAYIVFGTMYKYKKSTEIFHGFFSILLSSLNFSPLNDNEPQKLNRRIYCNFGNSFLHGTSNYSESVIKCQKYKNNALLN